MPPPNWVSPLCSRPEYPHVSARTDSHGHRIRCCSWSGCSVSVLRPRCLGILLHGVLLTMVSASGQEHSRNPSRGCSIRSTSSGPIFLERLPDGALPLPGPISAWLPRTGSSSSSVDCQCLLMMVRNPDVFWPRGLADFRERNFPARTLTFVFPQFSVTLGFWTRRRQGGRESAIWGLLPQSVLAVNSPPQTGETAARASTCSERPIRIMKQVAPQYPVKDSV